jgi:hypothetical protein
MPMKLNVGLSRKVTDNHYGSKGASVHVELELDGGLVNEPGKLQERIRQLFGLVRTSLTEELAGQPGAANSNGKAAKPAEPAQQAPRPATQSQVKAIQAIAKRQRLNLGQLLRDRFRVSKPEDLSIKQASSLITELNSPEGGR